MRRFAAVVLVFAILGSLSGCTFFVHKTAPVIHLTPMPTPTAKSEVIVAIPDGVMASGTLASKMDATSGRYEVVNTGGIFTLSITGFTSSFRGELTFGLTDSSAPLGACSDRVPMTIAFGDPLSTNHGSITETISGMGGTWSDPSFLNALIVMMYPPGANGCQQPILAASRIAWRIPETHPDIDVVDHGVGDSAWGTVATQNGKPFTYLTHQGDDWVHIAARFGITTGDLSWLNPVRSGGTKPDTAYKNQVLNLDPANRGDAENRRHTAW
jgi:hypothetical protein